MFFIDFSDIKFGTFLNYVFRNMVSEIGSKKYQQNCGQSFWDGGWILSMTIEIAMRPFLPTFGVMVG